MARVVVLVLLAVQPALPPFEPIQPELLSQGGALVNAAADYDLDGDVDLFVGFGGAPNRLYRNDAGVLADVAATAGLVDARATRAAAWGDFDADGDPDLLVGFAPGGGSVLRLYCNDHVSGRLKPGPTTDRAASGRLKPAPTTQGRRFVDCTEPAGLIVPAGAVRQAVWIDFDADGDLDLFVAFRDRANALFRNEGGRFSDVAADLGLADARRSVGAVWFDADEDGDLDLYVANMDGDANGLFRNDSGRFTDAADASGMAWGGRAPRESSNGTVRPCAADVNGDGRFDLFAANYGPNGLFLNRGGGRFEDVSASWGIAIDARYDTCAFADFDNDGRLDFYVNGTVTGGRSYRDHLFRGTGARFDDVTPANLLGLHADHGALWLDVDRDGDLDLALTGTRPDGMHLVMRNMLPASDARRSLAVRVLDNRGRATRAGAEVRVFEAGTRRLVGAALVDAGSGYNSQNDMPVHVGLGAAARVDVEVIVPARGSRRPTVRRTVNPGEFHGRALVIRTR